MSTLKSLSYILLVFAFSASVSSGQVLNWIKTNSPPTKTPQLVSYGTTLFAPTQNGLYKTNNDGNTWSALPGIVDSSNILLFYIRDSTMFASVPPAETVTDVETQYRSIDGGQSWTNVGYIGDGSSVYQSGTMMIMHGWPVSNNYFVSVNGDNNWHMLDSLFPGLFIAAIPGESQILAMTRFTSPKHFIISSDFGNSWKELNIFDSSLYPIAAVKDTFYVQTRHGIFRSKDLGINWQSINADSTLQLWSVQNDTLIATGKNVGFIISIDGGTHWVTPTNIGLPSYDFLSLVIGNHKIFTELKNGDIYFTDIPTISSVNNDLEPKQSLSLYPNPISSTGLFKYYLQTQSRVSLTLYDALGRIISITLPQEIQEAGWQQVPIDMNGLSPGIYYCRLYSDGGYETSKFVVSR